MDLENRDGFFVHRLADCQSRQIGPGTRVWQFSVVLPGARIGSNCNICAHTFIENDVVIGDNVTVKCGVYLWDGLRVEDNAFLGPNATFTNDRHPPSPVETFQGIVVRSGASIGAGAVILPGVVVGQRAKVGAGAVVTKDVPDDAVVYGDAARIQRMQSA